MIDWIAPLAAAFLSGGAVKILDRMYAAKDRDAVDIIAFRHELQDEVKRQDQRIDQLQAELERWKTSYFKLFAEYNMLVSMSGGIPRHLPPAMMDDGTG